MSEGQREHFGGKRVNILLFKDQIFNIFEQLKFGISRMEFEKLKFETLRMKNLGFQRQNLSEKLNKFYYYVLIMKFIDIIIF